MRAADVDILMIPGWAGADPGHWMTRWQAKLSTARQIREPDPPTRVLADWVEHIAAEVKANSSRRCVLVAHGSGVIAALHALPHFEPGKVAGAFLVAPPDPNTSRIWPVAHTGFDTVPSARLPFPAEVVASGSDTYCDLETARQYARNWGAKLREAGDAGHIDSVSGHGPWPEGSLAFAFFLKALD